jgi:hypothetical protein
LPDQQGNSTYFLIFKISLNSQEFSRKTNHEGTRRRSIEYTCGNNKKLRVIGMETRVSKSGYESEVTVYESEGCEGCPVWERCTTSPKNRRLEVSKQLLALRGESEAATSDGFSPEGRRG